MIHGFIEGNVFVTAGVKKKSIFLRKKTASLISSNMSGEQGKHTRTLKQNTFPASLELDFSVLKQGALCLIVLSNYFLP